MGSKKKKRQFKGSKPWHRAYSHLDLTSRLYYTIPKHVRAINAAKERLRGAKTVKAAEAHQGHIKTCLDAVNSIYSRTREALLKGYVCCFGPCIPSLYYLYELPTNPSSADASLLSFLLEPLLPQYVHVHRECCLDADATVSPQG